MNKFLGFLAIACFVAGAIAQPAAPAKVDCNSPPTSNPDDCCKTPTFFKNTDVSKCESDITARGNNVTAECIANCLLSSNKVFSNGVLDRKALTDFLIKQTGDSEWNEEIGKAVNTCADSGAKRADDFAKVAKTASCGPLPLFTVDCIYMQLFKNCPAKRWSGSSTCTNLKAYVKQCSMV